jgi:hypothetical protein
MGRSLALVRGHRGELLERARAEREQIRATLDSQRDVLWLADRGIALGKQVLARKGLLLLAGLALVVLKPGRALRWAYRGWGWFRWTRRLRDLFT